MTKALDLFRLEGRTALVTGGSIGIGRTIAQALAEAGARVMITARKEPQLRETQALLRSQGLDVTGVVADISQREAIAPLVDKVLELFGGLDVLFNNAGTNWIAPAEEHPDQAYDKVMAVCMDGPFWLTREVASRIMLPAGNGRIINVGSTAALGGNGTGDPGGGHFIGYHAAKGALHSFTRGLAVEWGRRGITTNTLCPGFISTEGARAFQESVKDATLPQIPLGRYAAMEELKGVAVFMASDASSYMNGHTLVIDGGISIN